MATENIVTGKYYRILKDKTNKIWDRISFWTHADDVALSSGVSLSSDLSSKQTKIDKTQTDFATVETSPSAHAYTKGQMLLYNNQLYRVIAAIAVGNTLTVGTNIEAVSVSTLSSMLTANTGNAFYFDVKDGKYGFYPTASKTASTFVPFGGTIPSFHAFTPTTVEVWYTYSGFTPGKMYLVACQSGGGPMEIRSGATVIYKISWVDTYYQNAVLFVATSSTVNLYWFNPNAGGWAEQD